MEKYEVSFTRSKSEFSSALFRIKYILEEKKKKPNIVRELGYFFLRSASNNKNFF